ncbi:hypothetical protein SEA_FUNSIZED_86 [Mycobacterium phage Funsized]|nr:hypothetical protein SEA_FUNSIZED_86 [Mycobacterium phage Funsized]
MQCPGTGKAAVPVWFNGPHGTVRRRAVDACPVCGKAVAPRKDGSTRKHAVPARPVVRVEPVRRRPPGGRVVTQK